MLYHELIEQHLDRESVAISDGVNSYSIRDLHQIAHRYQRFLELKGIVPGDRVIVVDHTPIETIFVLLACLAGGFVFVPVSPHLDAETLDYMITDCGPSYIVDSDISRVELTCKNTFERSMCPETSTAYIIYTSGSEGRSKGVAASYAQIRYCVEAINERLKNSSNDRILCTLPLSFDYGLYQIFLALSSGATLYVTQPGEVHRIPYLLSCWNITALPLVPSAANLLLKANLLKQESSLSIRYITFTGETLSHKIVDDLLYRFPNVKLVPMYGLTECKRVSVMPVERIDKVIAGSCGLPLRGVKVSLDDVDAITGIGKFVIEGPNVMRYWNIRDEDSHAFFVNPHNGKRCLVTGDYGWIDSEGFLYFAYRRNGLLKIAGYRISVQWIETKLSRVEGVREVAVVGIPDEFTGERAVCFVSLLPSGEKTNVLKTISTWPTYLKNSKIVFWSDELPKNTNQKIDKKLLLKIMQESY